MFLSELKIISLLQEKEATNFAFYLILFTAAVAMLCMCDCVNVITCVETMFFFSYISFWLCFFPIFVSLLMNEFSRRSMQTDIKCERKSNIQTKRKLRVILKRRKELKAKNKKLKLSQRLDWIEINWSKCIQMYVFATVCSAV